MLNRRDFFKASLSAAALGSVAIRALGMPGDKFKWACTSGMFRVMPNQPDDTLKLLSDYGYQGVEASMALESSCKGGVPEFKAKLAQYKIAISNYWGGGNYFDPANPAKVRETIEDNIGLAKNHIAPLGGKHLKVNLTQRDMKAHPIPGWWKADEIGALAKTLNEIGKGCSDAGVKFCFHPHNWTLIDTYPTANEVKRIMDITDPKYVYMVLDTAHLSLGGTDPVKFAEEWYPRIGNIHLKDVKVQYSPAKSGWKGPAPTREEHQKENLYRQFRTGGVDFVGLMNVLRKKGYDQWIGLDFDPPRPGEGNITELMDFRRQYLIDDLKANLGPKKA